MKTYKTDTVDLRCMDCVEMMRDLPDNSVDSIVCDPPYGLSKEPDMAEVLRHWLAGDDYVHKGSGFMGKSWDSFVPGPTIWKEAYRVLKPGGHLLAFAGSRTQDLMGIAIRLAGFECRDTISYLHSTDEAARKLIDSLTPEQCKLMNAVDGPDTRCLWGFGSGFPKSANVSKMLDKHFNAEREVVGTERRYNEPSGIVAAGRDERKLIDRNITAPATEAAKQWDGWGTALKPAYEPCLMFRKPLAKGNTVAANVLEHGTGAINVDGCRVGTDTLPAQKAGQAKIGTFERHNMTTPERTGRWPANLILSYPEDEHDADGNLLPNPGSDEVVGLFPVTGPSSSKADHSPSSSVPTVNFISGSVLRKRSGGHDDNGGSAARFFYCSKASKRDRDEGCEGLGGNKHCTVKPTSLMQYLVRLVTPPNGTVLDPFCGSGSTGKAAMLEGFNFIGCDLDDEYFEISKARILAAQKTRNDATAQEVLDL